MKELTRVYGDLLQDKRVRSEQNKYEAFSRQRNSVLNKYRKIFQAYQDLQAGLDRAKQFYSEMKETAESLEKNVQSFVENRRSEGGQLLSAIEAAKGSGAEREQNRLKELMERMSVGSSSGSNNTPPLPQHPNAGYSDGRGSMQRPPPLHPQTASAYTQPAHGRVTSPPITPRYQTNGRQAEGGYNPSTYGTMSPPAQQQYFSPPPSQQYAYAPSSHYGQQQSTPSSSMPASWQPPPPPPGPPPAQDYSAMQATHYPNGPGGYAADPRRTNQQSQDPWAGLNSWK